MSQRDLVAELRAVRVHAPREVRDRVHLIAAESPAERRSFAWRRALVVAVPLAAAVAAAVVITRPAHHTAANRPTSLPLARVAHGAAATAPAFRAQKSLAVPTTPRRVQTVAASLSLRLSSISDGVRRAVAIAASLSGYAASIHASTHAKTGTADLTLKVPRIHAQAAIDRLSKLGTIVGEQIDVTDRQAGLNTTDRQIARLQKQLAKLRAQHASTGRIAALTARIEALQRSESSTRRTAHYATIDVHLATPVTHKSTGHVERDTAWAVAGAAALALLLLAVRAVRRLREYALLNRP